jgi:hypothetical protein
MCYGGKEIMFQAIVCLYYRPETYETDIFTVTVSVKKLKYLAAAHFFRYFRIIIKLTSTLTVSNRLPDRTHQTSYKQSLSIYSAEDNEATSPRSKGDFSCAT